MVERHLQSIFFSNMGLEHVIMDGEKGEACKETKFVHDHSDHLSPIA